MLIFWGTRRTEEIVQTVPEYCPVHRGLHDFDVVAVRMKGHLYGISLGSGRLAGHEIQTREECGHRRAVDPLVVASAPAEIRHAERLAADAEMREKGASLDPVERAAALREAMAYVCTATELEPSDSQVNAELKKPAAIGFAITLLLLVLGIALSSGLLVGAFLGMGLGTFIYLVAMSEIVKSRHRKDALATAARFGIDPLHPSRTELETAAAWAKDQGYAKAKKIDIDRLVSA